LNGVLSDRTGLDDAAAETLWGGGVGDGEGLARARTRDGDAVRRQPDGARDTPIASELLLNIPGTG
jgi:hypothetical protein